LSRREGDGNGYLYAGPNAKYPNAPKSFVVDEMISAGNGRYYFAIMYGKNVMGHYADKLSFEERWQVLHYILFAAGPDEECRVQRDREYTEQY
jgi:hypothetical protein